MGGALGSMLRYGATLLCAALNCSSNWATLCVNVVGSFAIGALSAALPPGGWLLAATVGFCGGFTTFSTFSAQSVALLSQGRIASAAAYIAATLLLCIACAALGCWLGRRLA